jgi:predicted lipid-binding transport protein (Tim44 family)
MSTRKVALVCLIALFALAATPAVWAGTAPAPDHGQTPALAAAGPVAVQAPAEPLATPDPQAQAADMPVFSGIPGIRTGQKLYCNPYACGGRCPIGGYWGNGGCICC